MKISLVTDSTSDIPEELRLMHGIEVIPAILNLGDESYEDGNGLSREEFYQRLPGLFVPPTTSAPSVGSFLERYERLFNAGTSHILSFHPPERLSGIYNAARLAAEQFGERVRVIDSGQLTLGLGFQVLAAAESIASGALLDDILGLVESVKQRVRVVALLDTIHYLRRSGRVSWAKAMVGELLNIKPLVELRFGIIERLDQVRTRSQGILRLTESLNSWGPLERLAILHTNAEAAARQLLEDLRPRLPRQPLVVNVTTIIGTHTGPNGLGLAAVPVS
ncbi:MAG: DegV family protein [Anaerolineales bacterium]|jgi:DegV family protein with EDD domain|nr:DegV family protein [Anaerolineales bacterium]